MGFLTDGEPVRVEMGRGYWVDLKPQLSFDEEGRANRALAQFSTDGKTAMGEPDANGYHRMLVAESILGWNLTDAADQPLPLSPNPTKDLSVTLRSVGQIKPAYHVAKLAAKVLELNAEPSPEDEAQFQPGPDGSDYMGAGVRGAGSAADANGVDALPPTGSSLVAARSAVS